MSTSLGQGNSRLRVHDEDENGGVVVRTEHYFERNPEALGRCLARCREALPTWDKRDLVGDRGGYRVIYADPPWHYPGNRGLQGKTPYPTMTPVDLQQLPVAEMATRMDFGCLLFMWATGPKMDEAIALMEAWGFEYKTVFLVWRKIYESGRPVVGMGHWTRPNTEYLLVGTRKPTANALNKARDKSIPRCDRSMTQELTTKWNAASASRAGKTNEDGTTGHSEKPEEARQAIEQFLCLGVQGTAGAPYGVQRDREQAPRPYIELFARRVTPGWDAWGLEVPGYWHRD